MVVPHYNYSPHVGGSAHAATNRPPATAQMPFGQASVTSPGPSVTNPMWAAAAEQQKKLLTMQQPMGQQAPQPRDSLGAHLNEIPLLSDPLSRAPPSFGPTGPPMAPASSRDHSPRPPVRAHTSSEILHKVSTPDVRDAHGRQGKDSRSVHRNNLRLFLHGSQKSLIDMRGNYNVHRMLPKITKWYLTWMHDTFPSLLRLRWIYVWFLVTMIYMVTIAFFAFVIWFGDREQECVTGVTNFADAFFFVVQTIFTIGYGNMSPVCYWTHSMVTLVALVGMLQHTALTGIAFAKFTLSQSRDLSCAFSTKLFALEDEEDSQVLRLCFRFVNVFHRHFFHVSLRLFLVEHAPAGGDPDQSATCPTVEELHYFDTSIPLEFMSLPVEVCAYVPYARLMSADLLDDNGACTPCSDPTQTIRHPQKWVRYFSRNFKDTIEFQQQMLPPTPISQVGFRQRCDTVGSHVGGLENLDPARKRGQSAATAKNPAEDAQGKLRGSEFELVCTLEFTDATTGMEIAVRKSWPLCSMIWDAATPGGLAWKNIVRRVGEAGGYTVDVSNLDALEGVELEDGTTEANGTLTARTYVPPGQLDWPPTPPMKEDDASLCRRPTPNFPGIADLEFGGDEDWASQNGHSLNRRRPRPLRAQTLDALSNRSQPSTPRGGRGMAPPRSFTKQWNNDCLV